MKKILFSIGRSFLIFLPALILYAAKPCECGTQASGVVTSYYVGDGQGCCTGIVEGDWGTESHYVPDEGSTYTMTQAFQIPSSTAQATCCPNG